MSIDEVSAQESYSETYLVDPPMGQRCYSTAIVKPQFGPTKLKVRNDVLS